MPMQSFPDEYIARIGVITSQLHNRTHKLGGKTRNAPRIVPVPDAFLKALFKRMEYIKSQIDYPFTIKNETYYSVLEFPVACRKNNYTEYCGADDISKAARELFIEELKFRERRMSGISELMFRDPDIYAEEKDPTCYTCRRDYATELSIAFEKHPNGLSFLQHLMGHHIEDELYRQNDFTDEYYLHTMKQLNEESHRVNRV